MKVSFWRRIHGVVTHLPVVLLVASIEFGCWREQQLWGLGSPQVCASSSSGSRTSSSPLKAAIVPGQQLFLKNCAHCHGPDARGDEGPDLHNLDWTDDQIAAQIRKGKKGQMPAFAGKLSPEDISEVVAYLRTLK